MGCKFDRTARRKGGGIMSAAVTQAAQRVGRQASPDRYLPGDEPEHWTGKRKAQSIRAVTLNLRWPKDTGSRHDLFRAWHETAMQAVCSKGGPAIYVMAVIWRYWNVSKCTAWPTNQTLAEVSGKSVKTIVRGVNQLSTGGFINCKHEYIKDANGNQRRRRTIVENTRYDRFM